MSPFWAYGPPNGHSWPRKWFHHIELGVPWLVPTLFHTVPPVWSHQTRRLPQNVFWPFGAWSLVTSELIPMQRPKYGRTCSILVPHSSPSLEPPDPLMAPKWPFWALWAIKGPMSPSDKKMKKSNIIVLLEYHIKTKRKYSKLFGKSN